MVFLNFVHKTRGKSMYSNSNLTSRNNSPAEKLQARSILLEKPTQIVFIDRQLTDYDILAAGVFPNVEVCLLDPERDGVQQITQVLATRRLIETIHLVSHGSAGRIQLGSVDLSVESIDKYSLELQQWSEKLAPGAELVIYGCEVGKGDRGVSLVYRLSELLGVSVAAAATKTGSAAFGADWELGVRTGKQPVELAFTADLMAEYQGVMIIIPADDQDLKGDNNLLGPIANDTLNGGDGNDTINGGLGVDTVDGGAGNDLLIADYSSSTFGGANGVPAGIVSTITQNGNSFSGSFRVATGGDNKADGVTFSNIERFQVTGTKFDDTFNGALVGGIDAGDGIDTLHDADYSRFTADVNVNESGNLLIPDGTTIKNVERFDNITTGVGNDTINLASRHNEVINTGAGNDTINTGLGVDNVDGGAGNDLLIADYSSSTFNGANGVAGGLVSTITQNGNSFSGSFRVATGGDNKADGVTFSNIERFQVTGTKFDDTFNGALVGGIDAGDGIDTLHDADYSRFTADVNVNESGNLLIPDGTTIKNVERFDNITTGVGNDTINLASRHNEVINTGAGNDTINTGLGVDNVDGGAGNDLLIADYSSSTFNGANGVAGGLVSTITQNGNSFSGSFRVATGGDNKADGVTFTNIERFQVTGTKFKDTIQTLAGNDTIIGGGGADTLMGGDGNDLYLIDRTLGAGTIVDDSFGANDTIDLGVGANYTTANLSRDGKTLLIDLNKDGVFNAANDLSIKNFFANTTGNKAGNGYIENVANLSGSTILDFYSRPVITGFPKGTTGSNKGSTTMVIAGENFSPNTQIGLVDGSGGTKAPSKVYWVSENEIWATFDLQGLATGSYAISAKNDANTNVANNSFTVTNGDVGSIQTSFSYNASGVATLKYTNVGQTDVVAPLFRLNLVNASISGGGGGGIGVLDLDEIERQKLFGSIIGTSSKGPAGILGAGESGEISFDYIPKGTGLISLAVEQIPADEVIDWGRIKTAERKDYTHINETAWDELWNRLTNTFGATYGQFQAVMAENINYLSQLGQPTNDLARLYKYEWNQATNSLANENIVTTTDITDATPGVSLSFDRTFHQSLTERYNVGALGRGWTSRWEQRATIEPTGNPKGDVVIRGAGNLQRFFARQTDGTYLEVGGATLTVTAGQYRLKESNGNLSLFGTDGKLNSFEDPNGNRIALQYTGDLLTKLVHTNGDSLNIAYNAQNRISQITDSTGQVSSYNYDATGETLLSVTTPQGTIAYTYDTGSAVATKYSLLSITSSLGYQRSFQYDSQGRLIKEASNGGAQSLTYSYDSTSGVTVADGLRAAQTVLLNDLGAIAQLRGADNQNSLFRYDANGNPIGVTLPNGSQTAYSYDTSSNLIKQIDPLSQNTKFTYDPTSNRLTGFTDAKGNGIGYSYDAKSNLIELTYADGSTAKIGVDALGNVISSINRRGNTIQYTHDNDGQVTQKKYPDGSSISYGYDTKGNLTGVTDASGTIIMQYDTGDRLTNIAYPNGRSLQYTYNADGQRTKLVQQDGNTVNYSYDPVGRLKTLTNGTGQSIISYDYDGIGRLTKETNGNGTYTTYEYDGQSQLTKLVNYTATNTVNSSFAYTYNNLGLRNSMTTLDGIFQYSYDANGQLIAVTTPANRTIRYQYDAAGNRTTVTDNATPTSYATNNLNEYTKVGNAVYTYDTDGNLTSKTEGGQTSNYTYDVENRLVKVVSPTGTWDYKYDGLGNRTATIENGQRTDYLVDPTGLGNIVGEYNNAGNLVADYNYGLGLVSRVNGSNSNYYDADALGSIVGVTATDGSYANQYSYLPFGESLTKTETIANPFEYVGQYGVTNESNGLDFMRARFYDPNLGRFTNNDPIGLNGGDTNLSRYVGNNPVSAIDPSGLKINPNPSRYVYPAPKSPKPRDKPEDEPVYPDDPKEIYEPTTVEDLLAIAFITIVVVILVTQPELAPAAPFIIPELAPALIPLVPVLIPRLAPLAPLFAPKLLVAPKPPKPDSSSKGDPHFTTLDGNYYNFQGVGEFTLVKSTTDDLEIQVRQTKVSSGASVNTAIAFQSGGQKVEFDAGQNQVILNGVATDIPDKSLYAVGTSLVIAREGKRYNIYTLNNDLIQIDNNVSYLDIGVGLADNRLGKVAGLLGNNNNNSNDDIALRDGTVIGNNITDEQLYANSWRITQATSLFTYAPGTSTTTFTDTTPTVPVVITPAQRAAAEQTARNAGITDPNLLENAIFDLVVTNDPAYLETYKAAQRQTTVNAPNSSINPDGAGNQFWVAANAFLPNTIRFTNTAAAGTTPVAKVTVSQQLDADLNLDTFSFDDIGFGGNTIKIPAGAKSFSQRLDLQSTQGVLVDIAAELNPTTGIVSWTLTAIDPASGLPANIAVKGFLPPSGVGTVGYTIQPKLGSPNNTRIDAQASIAFNGGTAIQTTAVFNTIDSTLPVSGVNALPATSPNNFNVSWAGSDSDSGIASYNIFVAVDGGKYSLWKTNTTATSATYAGQPGRTYAFYSIGVDGSNNTEAAPLQPDTTTQILATVNQPPTGTPTAVLPNTLEDTAVIIKSIDLLAGFSDVDAGDILAITNLVATNGTLVDNKNGTYTFNPTANFNGAVNLTYSVTDGKATLAAQTRSFNVTPVNDPPIGAPTTVLPNTLEDTAVIIKSIDLLAGFSDVDAGDILAVTNLVATNGTLVDNKNGTYTFNPTVKFNGVVNLTYSITDGTAALTGQTRSFNVTPLPVIAPPVISIAVTDSDAAETLTGQPANPGQFTLTRTGATTADLAVNYTIAGTATNGIDDDKLTGIATFKAGSTTAIIDVKPIDDNSYEGNETVILTLADGGTTYKLDPVKSAGTVTITDNETKPTISVANISQPEGNSGITNFDFNLTLSNPSTETVTVKYATTDNTATAGSDYATATGIVTFNPGEITKTVNVAVNGDTTFEADETFKLNLSDAVNATIANSSATGTIVNDDAVPIVIPTISLTVTDPDAAETLTGKPTNPGQFTLSRTGATTADLTVNYTIAGTATNGIDDDKLTGIATFKAGSSTATIDVKPLDDNSYEGNETVILTLADGGTNYKLDPVKSTGTVTIADNETKPTISVANISQPEGNSGTTNYGFNLTLSNPSTETVTVKYTTADGTATAGSDYTAATGTITFNPGDTSKTVNVGVIGDTGFETDEIFKLNLSDAINAIITNSSATGTIVNDDRPDISIDETDHDASETKHDKPRNPGKFTLKRKGDKTHPLTVQCAFAGSAKNGTDYEKQENTLTFEAGSDTATIDINPIDNQLYQGDETVTLQLLDSQDYHIVGDKNQTVNITDNDPKHPQLIEPLPNVLSISGGTEKSLLKFTKIGQEGVGKSEVCAFVVDDEQGRIKGIMPGTAGYVAAALDRSQVIFSSLGNSPQDREFDRDSHRYLNFAPGERVQFALIADDTLDAVKAALADGKSTDKVLFSLPAANPGKASQTKFTVIPNNGGYEIAWEDNLKEGAGKTNPDFNDLVLKVETLDNFKTPIGNSLQGKSEGEVIDLRSFAGQTLKVDTVSVSDAAYQNYIGFYAVEDAQGTLANGLKVGDAGYAEAAIKSAILRASKTETQSDLTVTGGKIFAPVVIANGTFEGFLSTNPQNQANSNIHAYFNYLGANTDQVDHFRLLGDNKFGVEDLYGGGDRDYNDLICQMTVKS
jgi:RHS repeat-associated protein